MIVLTRATATTRVATSRLKADGASSANGPSYWELISMNRAQTPYYFAKLHPRDECVCASAPHRGTLFRWCTHECNVDVLSVGVLAPQQLVPARRRIIAVRAMTWPRSAVILRNNVSRRSIVPRRLHAEQWYVITSDVTQTPGQPKINK